MSWKTVVVRKTEKISVVKNQLAFSDETGQKLLPFHDLDCIVLENNYTLISCQLLAKFAEHNIFVLVCNQKHDPSGIFLPFTNHWKPLSVLNAQLKIKKHFKYQVWTALIKQKLRNSAQILTHLKAAPEFPEKLLHLAEKISYNDTKNHEGVGAKIFFRCLYGSQFVRAQDSGINQGLNYGYKILLSAITRSCSKYGLNTYLGVFHRGQSNPFNLSCDLMEPLRPMVDYLITQMPEGISDALTYNQRLNLIKLLQARIFIDGKLRTISNGIDVMVRSFLTALKQENSQKLLLPEIPEKQTEIEED